jgi:DNA polymerase-3 subunit alpha
MRKTIYHLHDETSNCDGYFDSCTNYKDYIKLAKRDGDTAIAFSNHGGIYDWIKKKQECDKAGIKYIHGAEFYMCDKLEDDDAGHHIGLYARNFDGVLELNTLMSKSKSKGSLSDNSDRHFYSKPRLSMEEIKNTSDNIIITTACVLSILSNFVDSSKKMDKLYSGVEVKLNREERARIKSIKVKNMSELEKEEFNKLKKEKSIEFLSKIPVDYKEISMYYKNTVRDFLGWMSKNSHRCFLEIQYHKFEKQIKYNELIKKWSEYYKIPMIAGTDTHSSNQYKAECRKIVQVSKDSYYGDEDSADLTWKTYEEMFLAFKEQGVFSDEEIATAIENTNVLADMVDDFELDYSFKYPTLYGDNANKIFRNLIEDKFNFKLKNGIIKKEREFEYRERIEEEFETFTTQGMESFLIFMSELLDWASNNGIPHGDRGSVTGSLIAYIIDITDVDPIIWNTVFSRFCNIHRISLGDIDVDFAPEDREKIYEYIINRFTKEKTAYILTLGTLKDRGTIDVLSKGLNEEENDLSLVKEIKNQFEKLHKEYMKIVQSEVNLEDLEGDEKDAQNVDFSFHDIYTGKISDDEKTKELDSILKEWDKLKANNKDLFYYFDGIKNTIVSKGVHAAGIIGSPVTLYDNLGVHYKDGNEDLPISSCTMKAVDSLNYVKFDILGLKTLGVIKDCYNYLGIKWKKSHEIDWNDKEVWSNMIKNQAGVFQFEKDYAFSLLSKFKPETINHMSMVNAALRPSGKSYRDRLIKGEINKNPSKEIDELLSDNNGYLIFQEDTIKFLTDICGFDGGTADIIRRAIGKKDKETLNEYLPKILKGYCDVSKKERVIAEEEAKQFLQIIEDSSEYQFGLNHSTGYSQNGYRCVEVRTHNPIVFTTAYLNRAAKKMDTIYGTNLAKEYGFKIQSIKFRKSFSKYNYDENTNTIYKGTASIKNIGVNIGDELYELRNNEYENFVDLLLDIKDKTSTNQAQVKELIQLDFFSEFGKGKKLEYIADMFYTWFNKSTAKFYNKTKGIDLQLPFREELIAKHSKKKTECQYSGVDYISIIKEAGELIKDEDFSVQEKIKNQLEFLGYVNYTNPDLDKRYVLITNLDTTYSPKFDAYCLNNGKSQQLKIRRKPRRRDHGCTYYEDAKVKEGDIIYVSDFERKAAKRKEGDDWVLTGEFDFWCKKYRIIKENELC